MVTYYVKKDEIYKVIATVDCNVYNERGLIFATCKEGDTFLFKAPANKISLSDDGALFTRYIESNLGARSAEYAEHLVDDSIHVNEYDKQNIEDAREHIAKSNIHITEDERTTWDGKANGNHTHAISDVTNLQSTLNAKADTSHTHTKSDVTGLDVGVKRIDYSTGSGEGILLHEKSSTLTASSGFSDYKEYKATKDVCLIYTVSNSPNSGQTGDFNSISYNYPLKMWMNMKVNGSYRMCEAAFRRICTGGADFIEVHLKSGDDVQFYTASIGNYSGYVRVRLLEFNYR